MEVATIPSESYRARSSCAVGRTAVGEATIAPGPSSSSLRLSTRENRCSEAEEHPRPDGTLALGVHGFHAKKGGARSGRPFSDFELTSFGLAGMLGRAPDAAFALRRLIEIGTSFL